MHEDEEETTLEETGELESDQAAERDGEVEDPEVENPLAMLRAEVGKWKDLALRHAAELENFRKRAAREREESVRWANQALLEELLPVVDHFEMGLAMAAQDRESMLYKGMDMVRQQLDTFLENHGVTPVEALGKEFDPKLHDAVSQEPGGETPDGHVLRVTRRGYMLRGRLLRPASVVVASTDKEEKE